MMCQKGEGVEVFGELFGKRTEIARRRCGRGWSCVNKQQMESERCRPTP